MFIQAFRHTILANQRLQQSLRVIDVIETVTALDAQAAEIGRAITTFDTNDLVVLDVVGKQTTNTAIGTDRIDLAIGFNHMRTGGVAECAGRTGSDAFAAGDAGGLTHRVADIEHDLGVMTALCQADDVVDLGFAAGPQAARALDAGIEVDRDCRVRQVGCRLMARLEPGIGLRVCWPSN